jgi:NAD-dependent deacetylase
MSIKKQLVVLSGAGISAESGLKTFRDSDGLWENYNVYEVATPEAWKKNPALVLDFYNARRKQIIEAKPNKAHLLLAQLEEFFNVSIITQNIDDLHERAGSTHVLHLHGEILKAQSTVDKNLIYPLKSWELKLGDKCEKGSQLRPFIVWFGEEVPKMEEAIQIAQTADILLIIGTSLQVYPAAILYKYVPPQTPIWVIDPSALPISTLSSVRHIKKGATQGMEEFIVQIKKEY